jgi:hypothetical protein
MFTVEPYAGIQRAVMVDGLRHREASISVRNLCRRACLLWISKPALENVRRRMVASHVQRNQINTSYTSD